MGLTKQEHLNLLEMVRDDWEIAQKYQYAYKRAFEHFDKLSDYLRQATFFAAITTVIASGLGSVITIYPGIFAALITGFVSAFDQSYSPVRSAQKNWESSIELDEILRELSTYAISIETYTNISEGLTPLNAIQTRLKNVKKLQVKVKQEDIEAAQLAFKRSQVHSIVSRVIYPYDALSDDNRPTEMGSDANNVIQATRSSVPRIPLVMEVGS
jgi:hypothetical protein